ncbi:MAG: GNAT family N-acetyltransferase [Oscillospiraceae bacterium]|jgi:ribosomal-protein-alanine N-acetyltransferase|nr:GNAT family N-acetyltransferase [Oscillospiraceae bacterium]
MTHKGTVTLETERLILRRFELSDAEQFYRDIVNDAKAVQYSSLGDYKSVDEVRLAIETWRERFCSTEFDTSHQFAVEKKDDGVIIGIISYIDLSDNALLGCNFGFKWWNNGFASEATDRLLRYLFAEAGFFRAEAEHSPNNSASGAVLRKCGFTYIGDNEYGGNRYAILAEDYFE